MSFNKAATANTYTATIAGDFQRPVGNSGVAPVASTNGSRTDRWLLLLNIRNPAAPAQYPLAGVGAGALDSTATAKTPYEGELGNGILITLVADSPAAGGVTIDEDVGAMTVTIHVEDGVSTVADVEAAASTLTLVELTGGTGSNVLTSADEFDATAEAITAGGVEDTATYTITVWGRDSRTKIWTKINGADGKLVDGLLHNAVPPGTYSTVISGLGIYDRIAISSVFGSGAMPGPGEIDLALSEVYGYNV